MADVKILDLPSSGVIDGTESIPLVQSGVTSRATPDQIRTYFALTFPSIDYEVGTFTASSKISATEVGSDVWDYVLIGDIVFISGLSRSTIGGNTGVLTITGLPFTSSGMGRALSVRCRKIGKASRTVEASITGTTITPRLVVQSTAVDEDVTHAEMSSSNADMFISGSYQI